MFKMLGKMLLQILAKIILAGKGDREAIFRLGHSIALGTQPKGMNRKARRERFMCGERKGFRPNRRNDPIGDAIARRNLREVRHFIGPVDRD